MHRRRPCNACWPDDLPMIKFKFSHCTTPGSNSGSITNNLCGVTQVTQHLRVPRNYCAQCPANNLLVVSVSIVAACPTLRLMLSLHPLLKTCTPAIPSQGLLPGHIIILPISEFEIFMFLNFFSPLCQFMNKENVSYGWWGRGRETWMDKPWILSLHSKLEQFLMCVRVFQRLKKETSA